jgi:hypothetical protein
MMARDMKRTWKNDAKSFIVEGTLKHNIMGKIPQKIHALSTSSLPLL